MVNVAVEPSAVSSKCTAFRYQRTPRRVLAHVPFHVAGAFTLSITSPLVNADKSAASGSANQRSSVAAFGQEVK